MHLHLAETALEAKRYEEALDEALLAIQEDSNDADGYYILSRALGSLGRLDEALRAVEAAAERATSWTDCEMTRSVLLRELDRPVEALAAAQRAVALAPAHQRAHAILGQAFAAVGERAQASRSFEDALSLDPLDSFVHRHAGDHWRIEAPDRAEEHYRTTLQLAGPDPDLLQSLSECLALQHQHQASWVTRHAAVLLDPRRKTRQHQLQHLLVWLTGRFDGPSQLGLALALVGSTSLLWFVLGYLGFPMPWLWVGVFIVIMGLQVRTYRERSLALLRLRDPLIFGLYQQLKEHQRPDLAVG